MYTQPSARLENEMTSRARVSVPAAHSATRIVAKTHIPCGNDFLREICWKRYENMLKDANCQVELRSLPSLQTWISDEDIIKAYQSTIHE